MSRTKFIALTVTVLLIAPGGRAQAAPDVPGEESPRTADAKQRIKIEIPAQTRNYTEQTPKAQRERGRVLFQRGNQMFEQRQIDNAIKLYRQAYKLWPHPRVLFNIAVSLGFLSRPLESARTFRTVLEYGPEPINQQRFKQASERYIELMGQLTNLIITCQDAGAKLFINGSPVGTAPLLNKKVTLGPGTHMITASLSGKVPYSAQVRLSPGELKQVTVSLQAFSDVVRYKTVDRYHW
ncbi:MAG: PEGA domain-containing protein, partial [bacterium]